MRGMSQSSRALLAGYLLAGCADGQAPAQEALPDLAAHRWQHRVLVIDTPSPQSADYRQQGAALEAAADGLRERDVRIVTQAGAAFRVRLVGKDGGVKLDQATPVEVPALFALIDAMPMRRAEQSGR